MEFAFAIYLVDRLDAVVYGPLTSLSYFVLIALLFLGIIYQAMGGKAAAMEYVRKHAEGKYTTDAQGYANFFYSLPKKAIMWWCMPLAIAFLFTPNKDTMYTILAAYGVQQVAENENVQEFAGKSLDVLEKAMDEYLADKD